MSISHTLTLPATREPIRVTISEDTYVPAELDAEHWAHRAYRVWITYQGRTMSIGYRVGMAHTAGAVDPRDVLYSIASDGLAADQSFDSFCAEYGYTYVDGRRVYDACDRTFRSIARVFKSDASRFYDYANDELG